MADNSKGGILNKTEKFLRRRKTKVLQSLGKTGKTTDEQIQEDCHRLDKQQETANKFQKDLRHYINSAKVLASASKTFYTTLSETYEEEWEGHPQVQEILTSVDVLWQDYLQKLQEQVQDPLTKYLAVIPQIKARVAKRGRKLIDYDNARHNLEVQQSAKKKDEAKVAKAQEDLDQAKKIYDELNNELHTELPEFYNSRVTFYGNTFQHLFEAEQVFHQEIGKVWADAPSCDFEAGEGAENVAAVGEKLSKDNESFTYTPRKNLRHTVSHESDEHMPNGHGENGNSGYESPRQESPNTSTVQEKALESESPGPSPVPSPVKAEVTVENGDEANTSKDSMEGEQGNYENADLSQKQDSRHSAEIKEVKVTASETASSEQVNIVSTPGSEITQSAANETVAKNDHQITTDGKVENEKEASKSPDSGDKHLPEVENKVIAEVVPVEETVENDAGENVMADISHIAVNKGDREMSDVNKDISVREQKETEAVQREPEGANIEPEGVKEEVQESQTESKIIEVCDEKEVEQTEPPKPTESREEPKVNGEHIEGDLDVPDHAPPPPPMTEPPKEQESPKQEKTDAVNTVTDDGNRDSLYQVPPPAKPVDGLPPRCIKTVIATHPYKGEDDDELTFESGEVIYVVEYDDPEDQDPGWLMGVRKISNQKGVFPENFTKPV